MRTLLQGGWIIGYREGHHCMDRDHQVVFEDDQILYVGPKFDGRVDAKIDATGKLVYPGFIDTHLHSGHRASHRLITDAGCPDYFGQPFFEVSAPREGIRIDRDVRYLHPGDPGVEEEIEHHPVYTVAEMLSAATLAGARSVGRDDLGRLAPEQFH